MSRKFWQRKQQNRPAEPEAPLVPPADEDERLRQLNERLTQTLLSTLGEDAIGEETPPPLKDRLPISAPVPKLTKSEEHGEHSRRHHSHDGDSDELGLGAALSAILDGSEPPVQKREKPAEKPAVPEKVEVLPLNENASWTRPAAPAAKQPEEIKPEEKKPEEIKPEEKPSFKPDWSENLKQYEDYSLPEDCLLQREEQPAEPLSTDIELPLRETSADRRESIEDYSFVLPDTQPQPAAGLPELPGLPGLMPLEQIRQQARENEPDDEPEDEPEDEPDDEPEDEPEDEPDDEPENNDPSEPAENTLKTAMSDEDLFLAIDSLLAEPKPVAAETAEELISIVREEQPEKVSAAEPVTPEPPEDEQDGELLHSLDELLSPQAATADRWTNTADPARFDTRPYTIIPDTAAAQSPQPTKPPELEPDEPDEPEDDDAPEEDTSDESFWALVSSLKTVLNEPSASDEAELQVLAPAAAADTHRPEARTQQQGSRRKTKVRRAKQPPEQKQTQEPPSQRTPSQEPFSQEPPLQRTPSQEPASGSVGVPLKAPAGLPEVPVKLPEVPVKLPKISAELPKMPVAERADTAQGTAEQPSAARERRASAQRASAPTVPTAQSDKPLRPAGAGRRPEKPAPPQPEEMYRSCGKELGTAGARMIAAAFIAAVSCLLTVYAELQLGFLPILTAKLTACVLLALLLVQVILCIDVPAQSLRLLAQGKFSLGSLLVLAVLAVAGDGVAAVLQDRTPLCAAAVLLLFIALWGKYDGLTAMLDTLRPLRSVKAPLSIVEVSDAMKGDRGLSRADGSVEAFMEKLSRENPTDRLMSIYAPIAAVLCLAAALLLSLKTEARFLQTLALLSVGSVPVMGLLGYRRLFHLLARRLAAAGASLCGWYGAGVFGGNHSVLLADNDLFPRGSVSFNGFKVFQGDMDRLIGYATATARATNNPRLPLFEELLESRSGRHYVATRHRYYAGNGVGAEVNGDVVLLGTLEFMQRMGVHMDGSTKIRQALYLSVNGELAAVFAMKYQPSESARRGLTAIARNRHFKPVLVTQDVLVTPDFLKNKFMIPVNNFQYPNAMERLRLSQAELISRGEQGALLVKDSFGTFAETVAGGRVLQSATRLATVLAVFSGLLSMGLMTLLCALGAAATASPLNMLLYLCAWLLPTLLVTGWTRHF